MKVNDVIQTAISDKPLRVSHLYKERRGSTYHTGVDLAPTVVNQKLTVPRDGKIYRVGFEESANPKNVSKKDGAGQYVVLEVEGQYLNFFHMKKGSQVVRPGQVVKKGNKLGIIGTTGNSTGLHIHFEVRTRKDDPSSHTNPYKFLIIINEIMEVIKSRLKLVLDNFAAPLEQLMGNNAIGGLKGNEKDAKELKAFKEFYNKSEMKQIFTKARERYNSLIKK